MKARVAAIAFLLAVLATGITWLSFQPVMLRLVEALRIAAPAGTASRHVLETAQQFLPLYLGLDLVIVVLVAFGILYFTVARPLGAVEREMQGLERVDWVPEETGGGPLLSRFQASLRRTAGGARRGAGADPPAARGPGRGQRAAHPDAGRAGVERAAGDGGPARGGRGARDRQSALGRAGLAQRGADPERVRRGALRLPPRSSRRRSAASTASCGASSTSAARRARSSGPVPVAELIRNAARLVGSGPEFREVTVETEVDPGWWPSPTPAP